MACSKRAVLHTHTALSESHMEIRVPGTAPIIKEKVRIKKIKNVLKDLLAHISYVACTYGRIMSNPHTGSEQTELKPHDK